MRISIVGVVGVPACYGGFETLVDNLLDDEIGNIEFTVYCSSLAYSERLQVYKGARLVYIPVSANGVGSIFYDFISIAHAMYRRADCVLLLGISAALFIPVFKFFSGLKFVTNIDGIEWRRNKWSAIAKKYLKFSEGVAVRHSDIVIADNLAIAEYVKQAYGRECKTIEYGGEHAIVGELTDQIEDYALTICRIEPENNIEMILKAFRDAGDKIKIVGNWDSSSFGRSMKSEYSECENIDLLNPIYDPAQLFLLREKCAYYVHGHSAGGTNPSLVEIMHFGKTIIAFDCSYNRVTTDNKALYFSDHDDLLKILLSDASLSDRSVEIAEIAASRYIWPRVRARYLECFDEL